MGRARNMARKEGASPGTPQYGCNHMTSLLTVGPPGIFISFIFAMQAIGIANPFMFVAGQNTTKVSSRR